MNTTSLPAHVITESPAGTHQSDEPALIIFGGTLERLLSGFKYLSEEATAMQNDSSGQPAQLAALAAVAPPYKTQPHAQANADPKPKTWPTNLQSLVGVSLALLWYKCWNERLADAPYDCENHAQRDVIQAVELATHYVNMMPPPLNTLATEADRKAWCLDVQALVEQTQSRVFAYMARSTQKSGSASGTRTRTRT